ncbi:MAG: beta-lactamase family protein, partial [Acidobacteria bacterium]|nr:beta-lactamase family protein [Acidobacteriota bacterium]
MAVIKGFAHPDFENVKEVFERNFEEKLELGASCAIYYRDELVVDLWGGYRDLKRTKEWEKDTIACVFSTTKGFAAICMALVISRGLLDLDAPVSHYWEEFAQAGKQAITVRQLLNHQAGLSAIDEYLTPEKISDPDLMAKILARQKPQWEPGTRHGYHGTSLGFFQNELLRRVDPEHRTISKFLKEEIADKLDSDLFIGLPRDFDEDRIAEIAAFQMYDLLLNIRSVPAKM